jgi:integrase
LLTVLEAGRQFGFPKSIVWRAIKAGDLKAKVRGDLPREHPANHPTKIKQGQGHRKDYLIEAAEMERFINSRVDQMGSPRAEYAAIVRLAMLFGCRYSEIGALRRSELDLEKGILHIKGKRTEERRGTKNKRDLVLPLPPMAIDIIKSIPHRPDRDLLFGVGKNGLTTRFTKDLNARIAKIDGQPIKPWRNHDLRHSLTTHLNEMGFDFRIAETITNHRSGHLKGMAGRYNHATYKDPVYRALEEWARVIRNAADRVVEAEPAANIVAFGTQSA